MINFIIKIKISQLALFCWHYLVYSPYSLYYILASFIYKSYSIQQYMHYTHIYINAKSTVSTTPKTIRNQINPTNQALSNQQYISIYIALQPF